MGRGIQVYLMIRRSLHQRIPGRKQVEDCAAKLLGLLTQEQATCLEQGLLPDEGCLSALADQSGESVDTVYKELSNFLSWSAASPQIRSRSEVLPSSQGVVCPPGANG